MSDSSTTVPPGPKGLPWLGTLPWLYRDFPGWLRAMGHDYGGISSTRLGPSRVWMVNEPEWIEEVLVGRHRDCVKDRSTRELRSLVGMGLLTSEGELWKQNRRLAAPPLQPRRIAGYAATMVACAERMFSDFGEDETRNIAADVFALTLEIAGKTLLGFDTRAETERVARIVDVSTRHFARQLQSWHGVIPPWVPTRARLAFHRGVDELDDMIYRVIARCRSEDSPPDHLLARLVHARSEDGEALSDKQIRDEAVTMLLAGHETTALTLAYASYLVSVHPEVGQKLQGEVDRVVGVRTPGVGDLPKLQYLDAVLREALRLYPPAYIIGREVREPFELGGYLVPRGCELLFSPWNVHRSARLYPEPERFQPERWLDPAGASASRFAYFPFGGGPRVCIGSHFALLEASLVLAMLVQRWELSAVPGFTLRLAPAVTLRPASGGVPVHIRRRTLSPQRVLEKGLGVRAPDEAEHRGRRPERPADTAESDAAHTPRRGWPP
jgi:cytochrome P450